MSIDMSEFNTKVKIGYTSGHYETAYMKLPKIESLDKFNIIMKLLFQSPFIVRIIIGRISGGDNTPPKYGLLMVNPASVSYILPYLDEEED